MKAMKLLLVLVMSLSTGSALAKSKGKKKKAAPQTNSRVNLGTDFKFDASSVYGRYQFADEALATVEDEKLMDTLLGVRMDFKDRLQAATKSR